MKFKFLSKREVSKLPKNSGVYVFKKGKEFLYIGKAANIRDRVKNHFYPVKYREAVILPKAKLFNRVKQIGHIKTGSEIEALILEANLIKKYQPKYNVVWKDDKNYFFVGKTIEDFPRIFLTHQKKLKTKNLNLKTEFVGPFVDGKALKQTLKILRKVFPYRSCKTLSNRFCLWYHLGRCPAPCLIKTKLEEKILFEKIKRGCQKNAGNVFQIFRGKKTQVLKDLKKEMKETSRLQDFEKAAKIRDQIEALEKILSHAKIFSSLEPQYLIKKPWHKYHVWKGVERMLKKILKSKKEIFRIEAYDISNIQGKLATGAMITFIEGKPDKNFYRRFKIKITGKPNDVAMIKEILSRRFRHPEWGFPDLILIDGGMPQLNAAKLAINNYQLTIPVLALAKKRSVAEPRTKLRFGAGENKLFIEGQKNPILLKNLPREIFNLILQLRDESHRFAISYHKKLREKNLFSS